MVTFLYMRRLFSLIGLLTVLISTVSAQFNGDGFYRVQNYGTQRYLYLTDYFMEKMNGRLGLKNLEPGFEVSVYLRIV